jgi:hypothetical protein
MEINSISDLMKRCSEQSLKVYLLFEHIPYEGDTLIDIYASKEMAYIECERRNKIEGGISYIEYQVEEKIVIRAPLIEKQLTAMQIANKLAAEEQQILRKIVKDNLTVRSDLHREAENQNPSEDGP